MSLRSNRSRKTAPCGISTTLSYRRTLREGHSTALRRITGFFLDNLERYLKGEELRNIVNKQLGFLEVHI